MKQKGFIFDEYNDYGACMKGEFAGNKGCNILIITNKQKKVYIVSVIFPETDKWSTLHLSYENLKRNLTKKYGEPIDCIEEFQGYTEPIDDNSKMHEVHMNRCKYNTTFANEKGIIQLYINNLQLKAFVSLAYIDKINNDKNEEDTHDDL